MHTENFIQIHSPIAVVYSLAADVLSWPQVLSHYRYVRAVAGPPEHDHASGIRVKMCASRSGLPVTWTADQVLDELRNTISYKHVGGVTRGMHVVWRLAQTSEGTEVTIEHDLESSRWWLRGPLARFVVGTFFVEHIADLTLAGIKTRAESLS